MSLLDTQAGEKTPETNHLAWIDLLRVVAIFQVILIHVSFPLFYKSELPFSYWKAANFYDSISRSGVPIFFMISGYLLLGRIEPILIFFRKRFLKIGIPTIVWTVAYLVWEQEAYRDGSMNMLRISVSMVKAVFLGYFSSHLWFIYVLIGLYLVIPILRVLASTAPSLLNYFLFLWLITNPLWGLVGKVIGHTIDSNLMISLAGGYTGYLVLGYVLGQMQLTARKRSITLTAFLAIILIIYTGTTLLSKGSGDVEIYFYGYLDFAVVSMSASFFLWFKSWGSAFPLKGPAWIKSMAEASFGIYLIHVFVIESLRAGWFGFKLYSWMGNPLYMIPLTAVVVFAISFVIVFSMQKIPVLKYLV